MLKIRLQRIGKRNDAAFRMVVTESTTGPKSANFIETLGSVNPRTKERTLKTDQISHWLSVGAQPSITAHNILVSEGIISGKKKNALPRKRPIATETAEVENTDTSAAVGAGAEGESAQTSTQTEEQRAKESSAEEAPAHEDVAAEEGVPADGQDGSEPGKAAA